MSQNQKKIHAELIGRDLIEVVNGDSGQKKIHFIGCKEFYLNVINLKKQYGLDPKNWIAPKDNSHSSLVLKEFILKYKGQWKNVYEHEELCHCRFVSTQIVEQAILAGAHTTDQVSRWTSASTACGTCKPVVEEILKERLK